MHAQDGSPSPFPPGKAPRPPPSPPPFLPAGQGPSKEGPDPAVVAATHPARQGAHAAAVAALRARPRPHAAASAARRGRKEGEARSSTRPRPARFEFFFDATRRKAVSFNITRAAPGQSRFVQHKPQTNPAPDSQKSGVRSIDGCPRLDKRRFATDFGSHRAQLSHTTYAADPRPSCRGRSRSCHGAVRWGL